MSSVHEIEVLITLVKSLEAKLSQHYTLIERFLLNRETKCETPPETSMIFELLRQCAMKQGVNDGLPSPCLDEFVLEGIQSGVDERVDSTEKGGITPTVRKKKHRMYVSLSDKTGMRLVETCCQDGEFH